MAVQSERRSARSGRRPDPRQSESNGLEICCKLMINDARMTSKSGQPTYCCSPPPPISLAGPLLPLSLVGVSTSSCLSLPLDAIESPPLAFSSHCNFFPFIHTQCLSLSRPSACPFRPCPAPLVVSCELLCKMALAAAGPDGQCVIKSRLCNVLLSLLMLLLLLSPYLRCYR